MLITIIALLVIIIVFILRILKLNLLLKLQFNAEIKNLILEILFYNKKIMSYEFDFKINEKKHFEIKYYKKGKLKTKYTLEDIVDHIKDLAHQYKKSFDLVEHEGRMKLEKFFDRDLVIENLLVQINLGFQDAATTALLHGVLHIAINVLLGRLYNPKRKPKKLSIELKPCFQKTVFEAYLNCRLSVRLSSALAIGAAIMFLFMKNRIVKEKVSSTSGHKEIQ